MSVETILRSADDRAKDARERRRLLADLPLFQGLAETEMEEVATWATTRQVNPGRCVYRRGEAAEALYLVQEGALEVVRSLDDGEERQVVVLGPGDIFGEAALLDDRSHRSEVRAVEPSTVIALPRELLDNFFEQHPSRRLRLRTLAVTRRLAKVSGAFSG